MPKDTKKSDALAALFPGREVDIGGIPVKVMPLGVRHIRKFSDAVGRIMPTIVGVIGNEKLGKEEWTNKVVTTLMPFAMSDLLGLIDDCVDVDLNSVPQWELPKIAEAWIEESFGSEEKLRPWRDLMTRLKGRFLNPQSQMPSATLSQLAGTTSAM